MIHLAYNDMLFIYDYRNILSNQPTHGEMGCMKGVYGYHHERTSVPTSPYRHSFSCNRLESM